MRTSILLMLLCIMLMAAACTSNEAPQQENPNNPENAQNAENADNPQNADNPSDAHNSLDPQVELDELARSQLEQMTLEQKVGQLFIVGLEETTPSAADLAKLEHDHVSGFILFDRNIESPEQTVELINELKAINSGPPLFIAIDEEGGNVSRLPDSFISLPSARTVAAQFAPETAEQLAELTGHILATLGFNLNFAPVLDVDSNPENPVIGSRSYGSTPDEVTRYGRRVMSGLTEAGVIPVPKHFPGHGDTALDSHIGLPVIEHTRERLEQIEFAPFKQTVDSAEMIMVGHLLISAIDADDPATLSSKLIDGLLREEWGFDGVVVTDDMTMGAITEHYGISEAVLQALEAGVDLILIAHDELLQKEALEAVMNAVRSESMTEQRIDESVFRIMRLKKKYELGDEASSTGELATYNEQLKELLSEPF